MSSFDETLLLQKAVLTLLPKKGGLTQLKNLNCHQNIAKMQNAPTKTAIIIIIVIIIMLKALYNFLFVYLFIVWTLL